MLSNFFTKKCYFLIIPVFFILGCNANFKPIESSAATVGYKTQSTSELFNLPPPKEKIVVTVYKFRDQTGQYKPSSSVITYSTAVTQGGTSLLIKALQDAGGGSWFKVVEREMLPDVLNERKLITQTREKYKAKDLAPIPPLIYSPLILEGGIIAYESNLLTGGAAARYLGIGTDTQFQRDTVTVYLRAVAVQTGEVLRTVNTRKTIFSVQLDLSAFSYLAFESLLEAELGVTSNEPPQMCVMEAIEKSVYSMVVEGAMSGLWSFKDPARGQKTIAEYLKNTEDNRVMPIALQDEKSLEQGQQVQERLLQQDKLMLEEKLMQQEKQALDEKPVADQ